MDARSIEFHPEALAEATAAFDWYARRSSRAPSAFMKEIDAAVESISKTPDRWPIDHQGFRRMPLLRFPYIIIYREKSSETIQIIAVAHGRRRPGYWRARN